MMHGSWNAGTSRTPVTFKAFSPSASRSSRSPDTWPVIFATTPDPSTSPNLMTDCCPLAESDRIDSFSAQLDLPSESQATSSLLVTLLSDDGQQIQRIYLLDREDVQ